MSWVYSPSSWVDRKVLTRLPLWVGWIAAKERVSDRLILGHNRAGLGTLKTDLSLWVVTG